ncbi:site-specific integrase [Ochrobactrum sp. S1502_03]|uniref:site-specific integrase n=1 Tax=Ochrobactrum sp. S1502_03 TaxID=3108451 RepID=UPI0037C65DE2
MATNSVKLKDLVAMYGAKLWDAGTPHHFTANGYLHELSEIKSAEFVNFLAADYNEIITELQNRGNKNSTINRKINALTKLLRAAAANGDIPSVPTFKKLPENNDTLRYLSLTEETMIIMAIGERSNPFASLAQFLIETGMNVGEAILLRWENISGNFVHIPESRIGLGRTIPLTKKAAHTVTAMHSELRGPFSWIEQPKFRATWNDSKAAVGLQDDNAIVPTVLRHTCACRLILQGVDLRIVQRWLGNRNYKSMIRYEALVPNNNFTLCVPALESFKD